MCIRSLLSLHDLQNITTHVLELAIQNLATIWQKMQSALFKVIFYVNYAFSKKYVSEKYCIVVLRVKASTNGISRLEEFRKRELHE